MKILRKGKIPKPKHTMLFICEYCKCKFKMEDAEQKFEKNAWYDILPYNTKCPCCGHYADGDYVK